MVTDSEVVKYAKEHGYVVYDFEALRRAIEVLEAE